MRRRSFLKTLCATACAALIGLVPDLAPPLRGPDCVFDADADMWIPYHVTIFKYDSRDDERVAETVAKYERRKALGLPAPTCVRVVSV